ncbi:hypothetical protein [Mesonia sp. HuA40]|uniref:hypothetical protein n=1 Tax=Mesonia sp. HuA40 TaxID=2602761 RepID=UPI0011C77DE7|nr:hypothetical protein [Mesonia sp. HuA40]TXK73949.1 hypothetical protein FT993_03560 [Mesonia sp. HuA40]
MASNELKVASSNTHFENILSFYMDDKTPDEIKLQRLSDTDKELKKRWEAAFVGMLEWRSPEQVKKMLMETFGISQATAYRDIQRCEMLFGSFKRFDKEAHRYISYERKSKLLQLALKDKNYELAAKIDKEMDKLLGLHEMDSPIDLEKIAAQDYDIIISKKNEKLIQQILAGGAVNMNVNSDTLEIDFEEINSVEDEQED